MSAFYLQSIKTTPLVRLLLHVLAWSGVLVFPLLFTAGEQPHGSFFYVRSVNSIIYSAILFYLNYFYLAEHYLFKDKILLFFGINIVLIVICVYGMHWTQEELRQIVQWRRQANFQSRHSEIRSFVALRNSISFLLTAGISVAIRATQKWINSEAEKRLLENANLQSQLAHLKYQLQPHFFFNSLNSIYSLIDTAPNKAKETVHTLGKLMRYVLYETNGDHISLAKDIDFLRQYIQLMQIRFSSQVNVDCRLSEVSGGAMIAPLLLVPLVENAFKHGVSSYKKSTIKINLQLHDKQLMFVTENLNQPKGITDESGSGVGLYNLQKRLSLLYPYRHSFDQTLHGEIIITTLKLQL